MRRAFNRLEPIFNTRGKEFGMKLQAEADLDSKNESLAMGGNRCPDSCGENGGCERVGFRSESGGEVETGRLNNEAKNSSLLKEKLTSFFLLSGCSW